MNELPIAPECDDTVFNFSQKLISEIESKLNVCDWMKPNQLTLDIYVTSGNAMLSGTDSITISADC